MKNQLSIAVVFLLVFLAGGVAGWFLRPAPEPPAKNMIERGERKLWSSGSAAERAEKFMAEFDRELDLKPEQTAEVRSIVESTMGNYIRFDKEHMRLRKSAHDETVGAIRALLDPAQQEKLDALNKSSNQRFQRAFRKIDPPE